MKYKYLLGGVDPEPKKKPVKKSVVNKGPEYTPQNPKTTPEMNKLHALNNLHLALRFKNQLKGVNNSVIGGDDANASGWNIGRKDGSANQYVNVDPLAIPRADSVIQAGRPFLYAEGGIAPYGVSLQSDRQAKGKQYASGGLAPVTKLPKRVNATPGLKAQVAAAQSTQPITQSSTGAGFDFSSVAPFLDNIGNFVTTLNTPKIPTPITTQGPRMNTSINVNPQLRRVQNDVAAANRGIDMSTSSAGVANANKGRLLAEKWRAVGDIEANKYNTEANLQNQAAMADYAARGANNSLVNQYNLNQMQRTDDVNQRYAGIISDIGSDIANISRENNMRDLDKERLRILMKANPDAVYQFSDTQTFEDLYKNDEKGLRDLIMKQRGTATRAQLANLYRKLFNKDI